MENFREEETSSRGMTLAEKVQDLDERLRLKERSEETIKKTKSFKWPFKWTRKFKASVKNKDSEMLLVIFLNKKNEIEQPKFMPIFDGNMVVWKSKPYEFDPRAIWTIKGVKGNPRVYLIKEIDRRPVMNKLGKIVYRDAAVSNMDIEEIRARGDSTESDAFLIKMALRAQTEQISKKKIGIIAVIVLLVIAGGVIWFFLKG